MTKLEIPFGATSTAKEVIAGVDLAGERAIVTGASSLDPQHAERLWQLSLELIRQGARGNVLHPKH
jgi:hypothetical protein